MEKEALLDLAFLSLRNIKAFMSIRTIQYGESIKDFKEEVVFTHTRLLANPHTHALASELKSIIKQLKVVELTDEALWTETLHTGARLAESRSILDIYTRSLTHVVLTEVQGDREHPRFVRYFGEKSSPEFTRDSFDAQIKTMRGWVPSLLASLSDEIRQLGLRIKDAIQMAKIAIRDHKKAQKKLQNYRENGPRKRFVDDFNSVRNRLFALLNEFARARSDLNLPSDFASRFFRWSLSFHSEASTPAEEIGQLRADMAAKSRRIAELERQEAVRLEAIVDGRAAAKAKELAEAEQVAAAAVARVAELRNHLNIVR